MHFVTGDKRTLTLPGIEPGIFGSVDRRLIHWAIEPSHSEEMTLPIR